jgi:hypothetical protein
MDANDIVFWLSGLVSLLVVIWAILIIRAYNRIDKED